MMDASDFTNAFAFSAETLSRTGYPPSVSHPNVWPDEIVDAHVFDDAHELAASIPPHDRHDLAQRAAIANLLYHVTRIDPFHDESWAIERQAQMLLVLRDYLRGSGSTSKPTTFALLRWELHAAAAARDLDRVLRLIRFWDEFDSDASQLHLLPRLLFMLVHVQGEDFPFMDWDPALTGDETSLLVDEALNAFDNLVTIQALGGEKYSVFGDVWELRRQWKAEQEGVDDRTRLPIAEIRALEHRALLTCRATLERLGHRRVSADPTLAAISAWCDCALDGPEFPGLMVAAAVKFRDLGHSATDEWLIVNSFRAAANCSVRASRFGDAEDDIKRWLQAAPEKCVQTWWPQLTARRSSTTSKWPRGSSGSSNSPMSSDGHSSRA